MSLLPGISVHHMVKDPPIERLAALDEYIRPFVSEIVIVADRCTDGDMARMRSWSTTDCPVTVIPARFTDFSETRNIGLAEHRHEWTLHLDPDELPSVAMLLHAMWAIGEGSKEFKHSLGWLYWTRNFWDGALGEEREHHWHCRLFRTEAARFYKPVHELVQLDGKPESETRGTVWMPRAPKAAYLIHSKSAAEIAKSDALYATLGEISK